MNEIKDALHLLGIATLDINSAIEKLIKAEDAAFETLNLIASTEYGEHRFFKDSNGLIYDRKKREYLPDFETALNRYVKEVELRGDDETV